MTALPPADLAPLASAARVAARDAGETVLAYLQGLHNTADHGERAAYLGNAAHALEAEAAVRIEARDEVGGACLHGMALMAAHVAFSESTAAARAATGPRRARTP